MNRNQKQELYDRLIRDFPDIERKGRTIPYTSVNGHMFTMFSKEGDIGIRLPREERESFLEKYNAEVITSYGTVLKEYVKIPDQLLLNFEKLKELVRISHIYVSSLEPEK